MGGEWGGVGGGVNMEDRSGSAEGGSKNELWPQAKQPPPSPPHHLSIPPLLLSPSIPPYPLSPSPPHPLLSSTSRIGKAAGVFPP